MPGDKNKIDPTPINITAYEDLFLEIPEVDHSRGFASWIQVRSQQNGKVIQTDLWETANPGRQFGQDGFLSYDEAKGKTFAVPMAFCNSPGTIFIDVRNREDFEGLRSFLVAPLRTHLLSLHSCFPKKDEPSPTAPDLIPAPDMAPAYASTDSEAGMSFNEEFRQNVSAALQAGVSTFLANISMNATEMTIEQSLHAAFENSGKSIGQLIDSSEPPIDCEGDLDCEAWQRGEELPEEN
jgi:hypothetical protein